jgi:hypothetical protein
MIGKDVETASTPPSPPAPSLPATSRTTRGQPHHFTYRTDAAGLFHRPSVRPRTANLKGRAVRAGRGVESVSPEAVDANPVIAPSNHA